MVAETHKTNTMTNTVANTVAPHRVMIMAGGTGGHVFPALAVADQLRAANTVVSWLGTQRGIESELVPAAGISLHCLDIEGIRGRGLSALLKAPLLLWRSIGQAWRLSLIFSPRWYSVWVALLPVLVLWQRV